jgi:ABC-2 type transport system permease protein
MILAVARTHLARLKRDSAGFVLSFVVPIAFFSIFTLVFGGGGRSGSSMTVRIAVVDQDGTEVSRRYAEALRQHSSVSLLPTPDNGQGNALTTTEQAVRKGAIPAAVVFPPGFGASARSGTGTPPSVILLVDGASNPFAAPMLSGLLERIAVAEQLQPQLQVPPAPTESRLLKIETRDLLGAEKENPWVALSAAGLGVMFLFFTTSAAGGVIIDEAENGTLERILCTRLGMTRLLIGKMVYLSGLATVQLSMMFVWGALFFGLPLQGHIPGFLVMTIVTALAASAFGLVLAAACRTRAQLTAVSNLAVLVMSALGGSLYPRFLMPEFIQKLGLLTLNAWALDGFVKVFWRDESVLMLWPQVLVLSGAAVLLLAVARRLASRWEAF